MSAQMDAYEAAERERLNREAAMNAAERRAAADAAVEARREAARLQAEELMSQRKAVAEAVAAAKAAAPAPMHAPTASQGRRLSTYGGAQVFKTFSLHGKPKVRGGPDLTVEEIESIPRGNLHALINAGYINPYPPAPAFEAAPGQRFLVRRSDMRYDVVEGRVVNDAPISTKSEAEALLRPSDVEG